MGNVVSITTVINSNAWKEVFTAESPHSSLQVYSNTVTGELEIVQTNNDHDVTRTSFTAEDRRDFISAIIPGTK